MKLSEPIIVTTSEPGETRWGYYQFPSISRLPSGELFITVNNGQDSMYGYGHEPLKFISKDEGRTWTPIDKSLPAYAPHFMCGEVFNGEYLVVPPTAIFNLEAAGIEFPEPIIQINTATSFFHLSDFPKQVIDYIENIQTYRWKPSEPVWVEESMKYVVSNRLCWGIEKYPILSRSWFEHRPIKHGGELMYADYRTSCILDDGQPPVGHTVLLIVSNDNGKSFTKRSIITHGKTYEPILSNTADGNLICVMRCDDGTLRPMWVTVSKDHGYTWDEPKPLFEHGVFPALTLMGNGALLLAYGRPGVWVSVSMDGEGEAWKEPVSVIESSPAEKLKHTCGYTDLLPISDNEALLVYSNFQYMDDQGQQRKSIEIRTITL